MRFAQDLANLSTCKRRAVGCVIVPADLTEVYSIGYNGPSRGRNNDSCTGEPDVCGCVHAEANAVAKLARREECILLSTCCPCVRCASLILNVPNIVAVYFSEFYRNEAGYELLTTILGSMNVRCIS